MIRILILSCKIFICNLIFNIYFIYLCFSLTKDNSIHNIRYDKLIVDDQVYIYNDSEKRIEKLPYSVYSTAATGTISSSNISHSTSHSNLYTTSSTDSKDDSAPDPDQPTLLRYFNT